MPCNGSGLLLLKLEKYWEREILFQCLALLRNQWEYVKLPFNCHLISERPQFLLLVICLCSQQEVFL